MAEQGNGDGFHPIERLKQKFRARAERKILKQNEQLFSVSEQNEQVGKGISAIALSMYEYLNGKSEGGEGKIASFIMKRKPIDVEESINEVSGKYLSGIDKKKGGGKNRSSKMDVKVELNEYSIFKNSMPRNPAAICITFDFLPWGKVGVEEANLKIIANSNGSWILQRAGMFEPVGYRNIVGGEAKTHFNTGLIIGLTDKPTGRGILLLLMEVDRYVRDNPDIRAYPLNQKIVGEGEINPNTTAEGNQGGLSLSLDELLGKDDKPKREVK